MARLHLFDRALAPALVFVALAATAVAAGAESEATALWRERMEQARDLKAAIATLATALLGLGLWLRRRGRADWQARARDALLVGLALATLFAWWHPYRGSLRAWLHVGDAYHYYVGAKYFDELGYQRLYHCTAIADAEAGMGRLLALSLLRDLESNQIRRTADLLRDPEGCKRHFTPRRWREFRADVRFFRSKLPAPWWLKLRSDHGYNPTPVWTLAGGLLTSTGPAGRTQFLALTSLDPLLLAAMFGALAWAFGWRVMCLALIYWGTNQPGSWEWVGGSILRFDWLAASLAGIAFLYRGHPVAAGALLAWAAGVRVFPGVLAVAALAGALLRSRGRLPDASRRFALAFGAALSLLVALSALWSGPQSWLDFARNSRLHLATDSVNRMGLRPLLSYRHEVRLAETLEPAAMDPSARWKFERGRTFEARRPWAIAIGGIYLAGLAFALRRQPDWAAAVLGIGAIPVALELGNYYFAITTGFACLAARRPEVGVGLLALSAFTWWVGRWGGEDRDLVVALASAGTLVFVGFVTLRLALSPLLSARSLPVLLLAGVVGIALPGCSRPASPPNLLLVVVDSLRADHLSAYGHRRPTSPALDALAGRGVRFTRAYATAPWTKPSVASLFTGLAPSAHGVQRVPGPLSPRLPSLPESLARAGFATGGVVSHSLIGSRFGFDRGFEVFLESEARGASHLSSEGVTRQATGLLDRLTAEGRPFFLFVHYFDPHYTYRRHPEYGFAGRGTGRLRGEEPIQVLRRLRESLSPAEVSLVRDVYDEEVRFTDEAIGRLLSALEARDLASQTWVFVTADHGEEFLERGHFGHTRTLHEELVRVPLIAAGPDAQPRVVDAPVSLASLPATLLELAGAPADAAFEAPSLAPLLRGASAATPPPLFEVDFVPTLAENAGNRAHQRGLVADGFKLIENLESGRVSLFDLSADPAEQVDLAGQRPELVRRLRDRLAAAHDGMRPPEAPERAAPLPPAEIERLRELGYLED